MATRNVAHSFCVALLSINKEWPLCGSTKMVTVHIEEWAIPDVALLLINRRGIHGLSAKYPRLEVGLSVLRTIGLRFPPQKNRDEIL
jgi:hypothetical protein